MNDHVLIMGGGVYSDATWPKIDVPYLVDAGRHNIAMNDAILTIEAGVELIMTQNSEIIIDWESALLW